ncbi:MAG TPA: L-threonylcarbamoyladenylate synthase [Vicinamibacteria bacterium]|nr:L-threonylcarbamoyladenylate synthase [Vicinamibacteria bacterium]
MTVFAVDPDDPDPALVARAAGLLRKGELVIYPTDTLYALGALAHHGGGAARVRLAKGRDDQKPLPLVAADLEQARALSSEWTDAAERLAARFWPGPLTIVVKAKPGIPTEVTAGTGTIAVRVPGCALPRRLCAAAGGALVSTSANRAGAAGPRTCAEAVAGVGTWAALALDGGPGRSASSTIVDLTGAVPRLARAGPIGWPDVLEALG